MHIEFGDDSYKFAMALRSINVARKLATLEVRFGSQGVNSMHTSSRMEMGFGSHSSDNDPDVLHKEKEKNLSGTLGAYCVYRA